MESAGLEIYAELGLILFVLGFIFVVLRVVTMKREEADEHARIPLEEDAHDSRPLENREVEA
jgi:cbb3-type cytochrome oxidase subunit 3